MDTTTLFAGVIFGSIGMGYLVYGKKQHKGIALLSGLMLCVMPYFTANIVLLVLSGILFMALPFFINY